MSDQQPPAGSFDRTVNRKVKVERKKDTFAQAGEMAAAQKESLLEQENMAEQFTEALAGTAQEQTAPNFVKAPRKDAIDVKLPNGLKVTMGPPTEAIQYRLARIYKKDLNDDLSVTYAKAQFYVRAINGIPEPMANSRLELEAQAMRFETDGLEFIASKYLEHFVGIDLDALKKNMLGF